MPHFVAPSILSADFGNLQRDCELISSSKADWLHVDVMDGVFVPNISFGPAIINVLKAHCSKPLDVHLMIVDPDRFLSDFKNAGASVLTVHLEACTHLHRTISAIKGLGMKAGVAINPHTSVGLLGDIIADIDLVCMMSVNPGFGGQKFIENTFNKISQLKDLIVQKHSSALIEIDGGVDLNNYMRLVKAGADVLVAGNAVFKSSNPLVTIETLKHF